MTIVIIGAGIVGLTLARALARAGEMVWLIDPRQPASEASWAAAGRLSVSAEADDSGDFFELCRKAAAMYPDFVRELEAETGLPVAYRTEGTLFLYHSDQQHQQLERRLSWQRDRGLPIVHVDAQEVRVLEPEAGAPGGYFLPGDCQVDNRLLCAALIESCRKLSVTFMQTAANQVTVNSDRVTGVQMRDNSHLSAGAVVNAAGAWASQIIAPGPPMILQPVKGHMLALATEGWRLAHVVQDETVYLVPRQNGRVLIGSTMENAGYDKAIDPTVVANLRTAAHRLVKRLAEGTLVDAWTGLRPMVVHGGLRIGPAGAAGYFLSVGHHRSGILLAPLAAQLLAPVIQGAAPDPLLTPFLP
jgi:glycine oxidase